MGPRNLLILFFSTVAVSLVILIILFSLFFKNIDFNFNTKLPSSAPELNNSMFKAPKLPPSTTMNPDSKAEGISRSTVNVPPEVREEPLPSGNAKTPAKGMSVDDNIPRPPVSDDSVLNDEPPPLISPQQQGLPTLPPTPQKSSSPSSASQPSAPPPPSYGQSLRNTWGPSSNGTSSSSSQRSRQSAPVPPLREAEPAPSSGGSGPPVPGQ
jgi:hypothetical protein